MDLSRLPPGAYSRKAAFGGVPNVSLAYAVPALVGSSLGSGVVVRSEAVTRGAIVDTQDALANAASGSGLLDSISRVSDSDAGVANYFEGKHFQITNDMIDWSLDAQLSSPDVDDPVSGAAGSLASGDYYYVVTALDQCSRETNWASGMSFASGALAEAGTLTIGWEEVSNATGYKVYRTSTLANSYPDFSGAGGLLASVVGSATYADDGSDSVVSGTDPSESNATKDEPCTGSIYYADYTYKAFEFNTPRRYTSLSDVIIAYGWGSQLAIMAELAMSNIPARGNQAPAIWCVAAGDSDNPTWAPFAGDYQTALATLDTIEDEQAIVVMGKTSAVLRLALESHCDTMSNLENKKERIGIAFAPNNTAVGSSAVSTSLIGMATALANKRVMFVVPDSGAVKGTLQDSSDKGSYLVAATVNPEYIAAAIAGKIASLSDTATPLTRKQIYGFTKWSGSQNRVYNRTELIQLSEGGICVMKYQSEALWNIYKGITSATAVQDDAELSVVLAIDTLSMAWRAAIDPATGSAQDSMIGSKLTPGLLDAVKTRTQFVLDDLVGKGIINSYDGSSIEAVQSVTTKTQVDVSFNFEPIFPVNTVILTFSTSFSIASS